MTPLSRDSERLARLTRERIMGMAHRAKSAHVGSCLSVTDILAVLYAEVMCVKPDEPSWPDRDRFVLSKGHAAMALYAILADLGFFSLDELAEYGRPESRLCGHVHVDVPGVEASTGSLGHGLSIACGMALAGKADGADWHVYCVLGDGECQEGSTFEALLFAAHHRLDNLTAIIDRNRLQACGRTEDVLRLEPLDAKWGAFGWDVESVDGHNHAALVGALRHHHTSRPRVLIAETIKGKGISAIEDTVAGHYWHPDGAALTDAIRELQT